MADTNMPHIQSKRPTGITVFGTIYIIFGVLMIIAVSMVVVSTTMMGDYSSMIVGMMGNTMTVFGGIIAVDVGTRSFP